MSTDSYEAIIHRLADGDPAVRQEAIDRFIDVYPELSLEHIHTLFDRFCGLEFIPELLQAVATVAIHDPELITDEIIHKLYYMLDLHRDDGLQRYDPAVIESIHIILCNVLDVQGPAAVDPAIFHLVDHINTEQWTEWGEEALLTWLVATAEPMDLMRLVVNQD